MAADRKPKRPSAFGAQGKARRARKRSRGGWLGWMLAGGTLMVVCAVVGYLLIMLNGERILAANRNAFVFAETTIIYDKDGREAAALATVENREYVAFKDIPEMVYRAFIAVEDKRFYEHEGVDFWAIGRALVKDILARRMVEGGSTITQQLAKNMFLSHEKTFFRKATEASIALALENNLSKDQILELYLNRIYFGRGAHGILAASKLYFGKNDLNDLEIWEIAMLAGIPKAPNVYNPVSNLDRALERMAVVLSLMREQGLITAEQAEEAKRKAAEYEPPEGAYAGAAAARYPAFVDYVTGEAERVTGLTEEELRVGGYRIYTTLNTNAQRIVERAFADPANFEESPDDRIVQGAMVIIDHRTGEIEAMAGGREYQNKGLNRAVQPRQPGSAFKPIAVYGPALETGDWFPWSVLKDEKRCYGDYCPTNPGGKYAGSITMRQALKESRNASTVWLLNEIGLDRGIEFAKRLGIELDAQDRNLAIALGGLTRGVTPLEMATAYSVFASGGLSVDPHAIVRIEDRDGKVIYRYKAPEEKRLIKAETAWYMTEMLQAVLESGGTGTKARINRPVAGKTGTTEHGIPGFKSSGNRDVWFVGYTPEWTAAVWMGYDRTDERHVLKRGSSMAAALFAKVMGEALKDVPVTSFVKPEGVKTVTKPPTVGGFSVVWSEAELGVRLSWSRQQGDLLYRVYRKAEGEDAFELITVTESVTALDFAVEPGVAYEYYVTAYDKKHAIEGDPSTVRGVRVPETAGIEPEPPDGPTDDGPDGENGFEWPLPGDLFDPGEEAEDGGQDDGGTDGGTNGGANGGTNGGANGGTDGGTDDGVNGGWNGTTEGGEGGGQPDGAVPGAGGDGAAPGGGTGEQPPWPGTGRFEGDGTAEPVPAGVAPAG
ncbi:transglycosylase domain-containing protein [Thermobacillus sp. ZCTH02-B1]|uniref:transglycosylase domain-containing protein n=1 Tax=Thermobacillus sp. ZCTH02-B1 TaxID=1858795 RepID=UPI0025D16656|nr:penicillin-binding protein 1A [Thermobacillus sp. ZCTH02-B1]